MNPFALTAEERAGAMMEPVEAGGTFMDNIGALRALVAPQQRYGNGAWLDEDTAGTVTVGEGGAGVIRRARNYIAEEPGKTYGAILPLKKDDATGDLSFAIPGFARDSATGILDMLEGKMTPEASMALLDIPIGGLLHAGVTGARQTPETLAAIRAYHGSPHRFDKFSLDKIGTGEGAQAYGHGLYFAESGGVAKSYQAKLSDTTLEPRYIYNGKEYSRGDPEWKILGTLKNGGTKEVNRLLGQYAKDEAAGASYIVKDDKMRDSIRRMREFVADGFPKKGDISTTSGALYTTKLNVEPDDLLDWDKPLSEQSAKVRGALEKVGIEPEYRVRGQDGSARFETVVRSRDAADALIAERGLSDSKITLIPDSDLAGRDIYSRLARGARQQTEASQALREAGIPGIRYLDQGSRGAGEGTRNFVIFDDTLIDIEAIDGKAVGLDMGQDARMARAKEMGFDYVRRTMGNDPANDVGYSMFKKADGKIDDVIEELASYGKNTWLARATEDVVDFKDIQKDSIRALRENKDEWESYARNAASLVREMGPEDIVNSAEFWDNPDLVQIIYDNVIGPRGIDAVKTPNGLIVFDGVGVRSIDAAFDPAKKKSADLLAASAGGGVAASAVTTAASDRKDRKKKP